MEKQTTNAETQTGSAGVTETQITKLNDITTVSVKLDCVIIKQRDTPNGRLSDVVVLGFQDVEKLYKEYCKAGRN